MAGLFALLSLLVFAGCSSSNGASPPSGSGSSSGGGSGTSSGGSGTSSGGPDSSAALLPGQFSAPLEELQRLLGTNTLLHTEEVTLRGGDFRVASCNLSGLDIVDASDPANMTYLSNSTHPVIPGNSILKPLCNHAAWGTGETLYTTLRGNNLGPPYLAAWNTSLTVPAGVDGGLPQAPTQTGLMQEPGVSYEGVQYGNGNIYVALHGTGFGIYTFDGMNFTRVGLATGLTNAYNSFPRGNTVFVADGEGGLAIIDVTSPAAPKVLSEVATGGVARSVVVDGNNAYVGSGSAGLVVVDVTNLSAPKILSTTPVRGMGEQVAFANGLVWLACWDDTRVYDVSNPAAPKIVGGVRFEEPAQYSVPVVGVKPGNAAYGRPDILSYTYAVAAHDNVAIIGNWHLLYSYRVHPENVAPYIYFSDSAANWIDFGQVSVGATSSLPLNVYNDGTAPLTLFNTFAESAPFMATPLRTRIEPGQMGTLNLSYKASSTTEQWSYLQIYTDDPNQPLRQTAMYGNRGVLGVGSALPDLQMTLTDGTTWDSSTTKGSVVALNYFATFCPTCGQDLPDIEQRIWKKYKSQGLVAVGVDPGGFAGVQGLPSNENPDVLAAYIKALGLTLPIGIETTKTYITFTQLYPGTNPFPVDVVVGKDGKIKYIERDYDPQAYEAAVVAALAE
jgi:peroxiredoxin